MHLNKLHERINGPHFNEEFAHYAVEGMENEDGTKGPHWTVEETTSVANKLGIDLKSEKHNKWDWYVAMNMIYSDFYKAVVAMTGSANTKYFAELAKAWLCDKDISEGKMWHYYIYIMCDEDDREDYGRVYSIRGEIGNYARRFDRSMYDRDEDYGMYPHYRYGRYRYYEPEHEYMERARMKGRYRMDNDRDYDDDDTRSKEMRDRESRNTSVRYF